MDFNRHIIVEKQTANHLVGYRHATSKCTTTGIYRLLHVCFGNKQLENFLHMWEDESQVERQVFVQI